MYGILLHSEFLYLPPFRLAEGDVGDPAFGEHSNRSVLLDLKSDTLRVTTVEREGFGFPSLYDYGLFQNRRIEVACRDVSNTILDAGVSISGFEGKGESGVAFGVHAHAGTAVRHELSLIHI